jgi:hypothetical protein
MLGTEGRQSMVLPQRINRVLSHVLLIPVRIPSRFGVAAISSSVRRPAISGVALCGLEAQRTAVIQHIWAAKLAAEYTEVESGKKHANRPRLLAALQECRRKKATLVIAKLARLGRNSLSSPPSWTAEQISCAATTPRKPPRASYAGRVRGA